MFFNLHTFQPRFAAGLIHAHELMILSQSVVWMLATRYHENKILRFFDENSFTSSIIVVCTNPFRPSATKVPILLTLTSGFPKICENLI